MTERQTNLLAALALALDDKMGRAIRDESGRGGQAPAALAILSQQDGLGIETLRAQLDLSQPATVRLVDALVADGSARRERGADQRSVRLTLTAAGRRRAQRVLAARRTVTTVALDGLTRPERAALESMLEKMLAAVTDDRIDADVICRLCDLAACPEVTCPVECAAQVRP
jgi:MarR family transcriptional repressor of emrRAB